NIENPRVERGVEITVGADLKLRVAALLNQRRQPPDFQFAADDDEQIGALQLQNEAGLGFDEVRILITARDEVDGRAVAGDLPADRRQILRRRHDVELSLREERRAEEYGRDRRDERLDLHRNLPLMIACPPDWRPVTTRRMTSPKMTGRASSAPTNDRRLTTDD